MSINLGNTTFGSLYLGSTKIGEAYLGNVKVYESLDPYNPLGLPPYTIRLEFESGTSPSFSNGTAVRVSSSPNIWDLTYQNPDWTRLLDNQDELIGVLGANTSSVTNMSSLFLGCFELETVPVFNTGAVTNMSSMFYNCRALTTVPLYNTSAVTKMRYMFNLCHGLTSIPLFDTSSVTDMESMFMECDSLTTLPLLDTSSVTNMSCMCDYCTALTSIPLFDVSSVIDCSFAFESTPYVESGALALYQRLSQYEYRLADYSDCFSNCGSSTVSGAAELAQIPSSWGGTGA
jgi:surface protein